MRQLFDFLRFTGVSIAWLMTVRVPQPALPAAGTAIYMRLTSTLAAGPDAAEAATIVCSLPPFVSLRPCREEVSTSVLLYGVRGRRADQRAPRHPDRGRSCSDDELPPDIPSRVWTGGIPSRLHAPCPCGPVRPQDWRIRDRTAILDPDRARLLLPHPVGPPALRTLARPIHGGPAAEARLTGRVGA